MGHGRRVV
jgi:hypothetical protein